MWGTCESGRVDSSVMKQTRINLGNHIPDISWDETGNDRKCPDQDNGLEASPKRALNFPWKLNRSSIQAISINRIGFGPPHSQDGCSKKRCFLI